MSQDPNSFLVLSDFNHVKKTLILIIKIAIVDIIVKV